MTSPWINIDEFLDATAQEDNIDSERFVSYSMNDLYPEWQERAHCRGVGVNYYFGDEEEQPTMSIKQVRQASKLCDVCPVYEQCLRWSIEKREAYGVWAGTSGRTRRKIFKLVDTGEATVDEIVGRFLDGQGDRFRDASPGGRNRIEPRRAGIPDAVEGDEPVRNLRAAGL